MARHPLSFLLAKSLTYENILKNLPHHPPTGGNARHDNTLWSWGGHSLESPLPKLLKELLLSQMQQTAAGGGGVFFCSQGSRRTIKVKLE